MEYNWGDKTILIVEDYDINTLLMKYKFEPTNVKIDVAENSIEFFNLLGKNMYDLVLMDINLGEKLTGIDLARYMSSQNINIPIIFQTACDKNSYDLSNININRFVAKPIDFNRLFILISEIFKE